MSIISKWQSLAKNEKKEDEVQIGLAKAEEDETQEHGKVLHFFVLFTVLNCV